jgi:hypothetical protein
MSSYSLPNRYQAYLGRNFFQRQLSSVADALPGVIKRGLSQTPTAPAPTNPGLPDMSEVDKGKSNLPLYLGLGAAGVLLLVLVGKRKGSAAKAA